MKRLIPLNKRNRRKFSFSFIYHYHCYCPFIFFFKVCLSLSLLLLFHYYYHHVPCFDSYFQYWSFFHYYSSILYNIHIYSSPSLFLFTNSTLILLLCLVILASMIHGVDRIITINKIAYCNRSFSICKCFVKVHIQGMWVFMCQSGYSDSVVDMNVVIVSSVFFYFFYFNFYYYYLYTWAVEKKLNYI